MSPRNTDRYYRDERGDPPEQQREKGMTPRRRSSDLPKPWWHAHIGLVWTLAAAGIGGFVTMKVQMARTEQAAELIPGRRDREVDVIQADIRELRKLVMERQCRE